MGPTCTSKMWTMWFTVDCFHEHLLLHMVICCEVYDLFIYLFFMHYAAWILDWYWCRILFITCFHDSLLDFMWNILCDVLVVITHHVMFWDPLLYVVGILLLSSWMFCFDIPFVPCWQDAHHACFYVILIGVFWLRIPVVEYLLEPLLHGDIFPCMIAISSLVYITFIENT